MMMKSIEKVDGIKLALNKRYQFNEFVKGPTNRIAFESSKAVVDQLGSSKHNPLFLYGATGLGKTHLMQAIGNAVLDKNPNAHVMYISSERFVSGFIPAQQHQLADEFREKCRSVDLLLIDDIQYLAGKSAGLEESIHLLNELLTESKQVVLTSDCSPKMITGMDARLISIFSGGLLGSLMPPELENRVKILLHKAKFNNIELPRDCARFMAKHIRTDVRELEGALNKVIATARIKGAEINLRLIKEVL